MAPRPKELDREGPQRLVRAITGYGLATFLGKAASLVAVPAITWVLAPETLGTFAILNSLVLLAFAVGVDFGLDTAALRLGEERGGEDRRGVFASLLAARLGLGFAVAAAVYGWAEPIARWLTDDPGHAGLVRWLALSIAVGAPARSLTNWLRATDRHAAAAWVIGGLGVAEAVGMLVLVVGLGLGLEGLVGARVGSQVLSLLVLIVLARDLVGAAPSLSQIRRLALVGTPLGLLYLLYSLREVDRYFVGVRGSVGDAGLYDLAVRVGAPLAMANFALMMVLEPAAYRAHEAGAIQRRVTTFFRAYVVLGLVLAAGTSALSHEIVRLVGAEFRGAAVAIPAVLFLEVVEGVRRMAGLGADLEKKTWIWAVAALANVSVALPLAWWGIPHAPLVAAPLSLLLGAVVGAVVASRLAASVHPLRMPVGRALVVLLGAALTLTAAAWVGEGSALVTLLSMMFGIAAVGVAFVLLDVGVRELATDLRALLTARDRG